MSQQQVISEKQDYNNYTEACFQQYEAVYQKNKQKLLSIFEKNCTLRQSGFLKQQSSAKKTKKIVKACKDLSAENLQVLQDLSDLEGVVHEMITMGFLGEVALQGKFPGLGITELEIIYCERVENFLNLINEPKYLRLLAYLRTPPKKLNQFQQLVAQRVIEIRTTLFPYLFSSPLSRLLVKPFGYAGDYLVIENIYTYATKFNQNKVQIETALEERKRDCLNPAELFIQKIYNVNAMGAVVHRRYWLAEQFALYKPQHILSIGCGPCHEITDFFLNMKSEGYNRRNEIPQDYKPNFIGIDMDPRTVKHSQKRKQLINISDDQLSIVNYNINLLAINQVIDPKLQQLNGKTDLIYSMGLIDYLTDQKLVFLLNWIYSQSREGGLTILGNFYSENQSRGTMELITDWHLVHRNEAEFLNLIKQSSFAPCLENQDRHVSFHFDPKKSQMFVQIIKPINAPKL